MDTTQFDNRISELIARKVEIESKMETAVQEYCAVAVDFCGQWVRNKAKEVVTADSTHTEQLGREGLTKLKAEVEQLASDMFSIVHRHVDIDTWWDHREVQYRGDHKANGYMPSNAQPSMAMKKVLGELGRIFERYGYIRITEEFGEWRKERGGNALIFIGDYNIPDELRNTYENYKSLRAERVDIRTEISNIEDEKAEAKASKMWDEA